MWWFLLLYLPYLCAGQDTIVSEQDPELFSYFVTRPDIEAPKWQIQTVDATALQHGFYWFVAPYLKLEQDTFPMWNGPYIYRTNGQLIWSGGSFFTYHNIHDFRMSYVNGRKMISLIRSQSEDGAAQLYDETYTHYKTLDITSGFDKANMHDFNLIDRGTRALALLHQHPSITPVPGIGNESCKVKWEGFMEIDTSSNNILYEWNALGHLALNESDLHSSGKHSLAEVCSHQHGTWDAQHVNAVDKFPDGDYLLSARNADAIYKISHRDHSIVWRLGGRLSDFVFVDESARFERQHHARVRGQNSTHILLSVFNNAQKSGFYSDESIPNHTAGLILSLRLDKQPMTAEVVTRFDKPWWGSTFDDLTNKTQTRGSMEILPNGNVFMGWVRRSHISEHAPDGRLLQQAALLKEDANTYRSYKMPWVGKPAAPPDVVTRLVKTRNKAPLTTRVYVSWNGATEVAKWHVLRVGWRSFGSRLLASKDSAGFETAIDLDDHVDQLTVAGIDAKGKELGRSVVITAASAGKLKPSSVPLGPIIGTAIGGLTGLLVFLGVLFRRRVLKYASKVKQAFARGPVDYGEYDGLLAAAAADEEQRDDKEAIEMGEYKDSLHSRESDDTPG